MDRCEWRGRRRHFSEKTRSAFTTREFVVVVGDGGTGSAGHTSDFSGFKRRKVGFEYWWTGYEYIHKTNSLFLQSSRFVFSIDQSTSVRGTPSGEFVPTINIPRRSRAGRPSSTTTNSYESNRTKPLVNFSYRFDDVRVQSSCHRCAFESRWGRTDVLVIYEKRIYATRWTVTLFVFRLDPRECVRVESVGRSSSRAWIDPWSSRKRRIANLLDRVEIPIGWWLCRNNRNANYPFA